MSTENQNNQQTTQQGGSQNANNQQAAAGQQGAAQQTGGGEGGQGQQQAGQQTTQQTTQQQSPPPGLTPEQIQTLVKTAVGEVAQQNAPQEAPEVTLAKFNKAFNVYEFDPAKLQRLGYSDEQIESVRPIYEDMRDGLVRQAVTMSNYQIGLMRDELMKSIAPAIQVAQQQMENQLKAEFLDKHKDLVGYEPLLEEIKNRYVAQKRQFKSKEELFTTISTEAKAIIQSVFAKGGTTTGNGTTTGGQQTQQTQQQSHRMSTVSAGGQGGAGAAASGGDKPGWLKALE